jgi:hypothetical protein
MLIQRMSIDGKSAIVKGKKFMISHELFTLWRKGILDGSEAYREARLDAIASHAGCDLGEAIKPLANNVSSAGLTPDQRR